MRKVMKLKTKGGFDYVLSDSILLRCKTRGGW